MKIKDQDHNVYHLKKIALLKQIISINEEFLSNLEDWKSYDVHLNKRDEVFHRLTDLNAVWDDDVMKFLTDSQRGEINHAIELILSLDNDISAAINRERSQTLNTIKNKAMEKKITGYAHTNFSENSPISRSDFSLFC